MMKVPAIEMALVALLACAAAGEVRAAGGSVADLSGAAKGASELAHGDIEKAVVTYTEALKDKGLANDRRATILNDRAVANARLGQEKLALEDYNHAIELFPEYPVAYNNRGNLLVSIGQLNEAMKDFDRAVVLAPSYGAAYSNRANAELKLGKHRAAVADFTKAIELMPATAAPLSGRGLAHLEAGKPHAAIRDFSRAVSADARFASAYRNRAEARVALGESDEAIEDYSRAVAFDVNNPELYVDRGYAYLLAGNTDSAIKDFSRAIELDANSNAAYQGRGLANGMAGATDDAFSDLNRAIELDPRSPVAFAFRALVYKQMGKVDIASKDVETALKLDPHSPEALWVRGEIAAARGQADTAIADLRRVLQLRPGWKFAADALSRLGAPVDDIEDKPLPALDIDGWHVVQHGKDYFALSDDYPQLRIPLEMTGDGLPKLLAWDVKEPPYSGYGVLRFSGGKVAGKNGFEETELAAIVDLRTRKLMGIEPQRRGAKVSTWAWNGDRLEVAAVDGVVDAYQLQPAAVAVAGQGGSSRRDRYGDANDEAWSPWNNPFGTPSSRNDHPQRRHRKPKTIFDFLFGN